jgi:glycosyltransferase involved in cell wall biosynthesis
MTSRAETGVLLSICVPTWNRRERVAALVRDLLAWPGDFQLCVAIDGSTDGTEQALRALDDPRLALTSGPNRGRAAALAAAVALARGRFIMLFDDDDSLAADGLAAVLRDCGAPLPEGCLGYIYHLADESGARLGSLFPRACANLLALRADFHVRGDKKEVVLAEALHAAMAAGPAGCRRIPTSLYWSRLALAGDMVCRNQVIGCKRYLPGGMSRGIRGLKAANAYPMLLLYLTQLRGFARRRYRSPIFALRACMALPVYALLAGWSSWRGVGARHA